MVVHRELFTAHAKATAMSEATMLLLHLLLSAGACVRQPPLASRRAVVTALGSVPLFMASQQGSALAPGALTLGSAALKRQRAQQSECYEALECVSDVPYYAIECDRGDEYCLQRKQRLAREAREKFQENPGGAVGVAAIFALGAVNRLLRSR